MSHIAKRLSVMHPPASVAALQAVKALAALTGRRTPDGNMLQGNTDVVDCLLSKGHVAAVPDTAYGLSPHFRISTAPHMVLTEAIARIRRAVAALEPDEATL